MSAYIIIIRNFRFVYFFFNDTATTEIYTLSLHDALPICAWRGRMAGQMPLPTMIRMNKQTRSEEHTSELQSRLHLVCRLLLEKKKKSYTHVSLHNGAIQSIMTNDCSIS